MKLITSILFCYLLAFQISFAQDSINNKVFYDADFDWTITLPSSFELLDNTDWEEMQSKGENALEETIGEEVTNYATTIFVFSAGQLNFLEANYQPFDALIDGDYHNVRQNVNELLFIAMQSQMPTLQLDSSSTKVVVNDLEFWQFDITIPLNQEMTMKTSMYSRLFDKKEFTVSIMYIDEEKGKQMEQAFFNSTFGKKENGQ